MAGDYLLQRLGVPTEYFEVMADVRELNGWRDCSNIKREERGTMIKITVCDEKNEAAVLTEKINEIFEKDETMIRMSYFKNASLLRYEVEDRVYFDLYILVIQQEQTEREKQLMKTVRKRDSEAFFLVLTDKFESTLAFPIKSVQIIAKNAPDDQIENIIEDVKAAMEKRKKQCYIMKNQAGTWRILYKDIQSITHDGKYSIFLVQGASCIIKSVEVEN